MEKRRGAEERIGYVLMTGLTQIAVSRSGCVSRVEAVGFMIG